MRSVRWTNQRIFLHINTHQIIYVQCQLTTWPRSRCQAVRVRVAGVGNAGQHSTVLFYRCMTMAKWDDHRALCTVKRFFWNWILWRDERAMGLAEEIVLTLFFVSTEFSFNNGMTGGDIRSQRMLKLLLSHACQNIWKANKHWESCLWRMQFRWSGWWSIGQVQQIVFQLLNSWWSILWKDWQPLNLQDSTNSTT